MESLSVTLSLRNTNIGEKVLTGSQGKRAEHMTPERMHLNTHRPSSLAIRNGGRN
jgi:hypothetical protein